MDFLLFVGINEFLWGISYIFYLSYNWPSRNLSLYGSPKLVEPRRENSYGLTLSWSLLLIIIFLGTSYAILTK
jgi:hypothetical protein